MKRLDDTESVTSLVVQWLKLPLSMQELRGQSLVEELRSHVAGDQKNKT